MADRQPRVREDAAAEYILEYGEMHADAGEPVGLGACGAPLQTSVEKLEGALEQLADAKGDDQAQALVLGTIRPLLPVLRRFGYIPDDPADLDETLLACARWCLGMRSDHAWQPDTIDDLFIGPEPPTDTTATEDQ